MKEQRFWESFKLRACQLGLLNRLVPIDLDATDVEVYQKPFQGSLTAKRGYKETDHLRRIRGARGWK